MANTLDLSIVQGDSWGGDVNIYYAQDLTGYALKGQIRSDYRDRAGVLYADFDFEPLTYSSVSINGATPAMRAVIRPRLSKVKTAAIPIPRKNLWYYDIFAISALASVLIVSGRVSIFGSVTEI
jgi:hypothetical protein